MTSFVAETDEPNALYSHPQNKALLVPIERQVHVHERLGVVPSLRIADEYLAPVFRCPDQMVTMVKSHETTAADDRSGTP